MNKFDYQFKQRLENLEAKAPEGMWDKISTELQQEEKKGGKLLSLSGKRSWLWKTATAAALVISIISIALTTSNQSANNPNTASEQNSFLEGYGNGFEQPSLTEDESTVASSENEETENEDLMAEEATENSNPDINSPSYSMKMLNDKEVSSVEYEILGPDKSIEADASMIRELMANQGKVIVDATREGFQK